MKKLFTVLFSFGAAYAIAQPTITSSFVPVAGDNLVQQSADTTGINPGNAGANVTWNFASLVNAGSPQVNNYISPVGTPYSSNFPAATICAKTVSTGGATAYMYCASTATTYSQLGIGTTAYIYNYTDPMIMMQFPTTYNTTYTDNVKVIYTVNGVDVYRRAVVTSTADGYGTLTTPGGTFTNALRIKTIQSYNDSFVYLGSTVGLGTSLITSYAWVTPGNKNTLMQIAYTNVVQNSVPSNSISVIYAPAGAVGLNEVNHTVSKISVYPNPVKENATVIFDLDNKSDINYEVTDITGKQIIMKDAGICHEGKNSINIDCTGLNEGFYFVKLYTSKSLVSTSKFIVD